MKAFTTDQFVFPLPENHRFPMRKYRRLRERIESHAIGQRVQLLEAPRASDDELLLVHARDYLEKLIAGQLSSIEEKRIGFPWSHELVERSRRSTGATIGAAHSAMEDGVAANLAGGTHHAFADFGHGFCVFNDVAVAIRVLQRDQAVNSALVIDCDVHQGNGTAAIFDGDSTVFTFSMHGARNYPFRKHEGDLDIALPDGTADQQYLDQLKAAIDEQLPWKSTDCVFYLAGADPFQRDRLGRLKLTQAGLAQRDQLVMDACLDRQLPLVIVMAGGYADDIEQIVDIHLQTIVLAAGGRT